MTAAMRKPEPALLLQGDCMKVMGELEPQRVDAIVTDPPYGLEFMGAKWDRLGDGRIREGGSAGEAMEAWHRQWAEPALRVLRPGGHLLAFGGTRTYHRLTCALEDAGFEIRDSTMWLYGSGFPKSLDVSKAIDKAGGESPKRQAEVLRAARERADLSRDDLASLVGCTPSSVRDWEEGRARASGLPVEFIVPSAEYREKLAEHLGYTADERAVIGVVEDRRGDGTVIGLGHSGVAYGDPSTANGLRWEGWGTALKPAHEPIVVARKPLIGPVAQNVLEHRTGGINVGACRIGAGSAAGRWPANVVLSHLDECEQIGVVEARSDGHFPAARGVGGLSTDGHSGQKCLGERNTSGEPAETWECAPGCPVADLDEQSGLLVSGANPIRRSSDKRRGIYGDFAGQENANPRRGADRGGASRFFYCAKTSQAERNAGLPELLVNDHPTVKPIGLVRWLVRLVTPPGGRVLDPFLGSGSTGCAAALEGFDFTGIERLERYIAIAKPRITFWAQHEGQEVKAVLAQLRRSQRSGEREGPS